MDTFSHFVREMGVQVEFARRNAHIPRDVYHALATVLEAASAAEREKEPK